MRFIEFLMNEDIDSELNLMDTRNRKMANMPDKIKPKDQINLANTSINNLRKQSKSADKHSTFKVKSDRPISPEIYGDKRIVKLARDHEVDSGTPQDLVHYEMQSTQPKVKSNREMLLGLSRKKAGEINAGKSRKQ